MKIEAFIKWAKDYETQRGSRPRAVALNPLDVDDIYEELSAMPGSVARNSAALTVTVAPNGFAEDYFLTLVGVDVHRSARVPVGEFGLD